MWPPLDMLNEKSDKLILENMLTNNIIRNIVLITKQYSFDYKNCDSLTKGFQGRQKHTKEEKEKQKRGGRDKMAFQVGSAFLDACVLAVLAREDTYGYTLTQRMKRVVDISESTLYPVLRRLQKSGYLSTYDSAYQGRNRRYYRITEAGMKQFELYRDEWIWHKARVDELMFGEETAGERAEAESLDGQPGEQKEQKEQEKEKDSGVSLSKEAAGQKNEIGGGTEHE